MTKSEHIYRLTHRQLAEYKSGHPHLTECSRCQVAFVDDDIVRRAGVSRSIYHLICWEAMRR